MLPFIFLLSLIFWILTKLVAANHLETSHRPWFDQTHYQLNYDGTWILK